MLKNIFSRACRQPTSAHVGVRNFMTTTTNAAARRGPMAYTWSEHLSFGTPESDFASSPPARLVRSSTTAARPEWTEQLSFASPYADFATATERELEEAEKANNDWSATLSFASPESDFTAESAHIPAMSPEAVKDVDWSDSLTFASASADFMAPTHDEQHPPEMDLTDKDHVHHVFHPEFQRHTMAHSAMSFAGALSDFTSPLIVEAHDAQLKLKLSAVSPPQPLPSSLSEILAAASEEEAATTEQDQDVVLDHRAIVVTEMSHPFRIVHVNAAWEGLCGYTLEQSRGQTLGDLLQGPETDLTVVNSLMDKLERNGEGEAIITNYTGSGRKFRNHLRVGTLKADDADDDEAVVTHFVGILRDIDAVAMEPTTYRAQQVAA